MSNAKSGHSRYCLGSRLFLGGKDFDMAGRGQAASRRIGQIIRAASDDPECNHNRSQDRLHRAFCIPAKRGFCKAKKAKCGGRAVFASGMRHARTSSSMKTSQTIKVAVFIITLGYSISVTHVQAQNSVASELLRTAGQPAQATSQVGTNDSRFIQAAARFARAETSLATLGKERAQDSQVRQFAELILSRHTEANKEIMRLAADKRVPLPKDQAEPGQGGTSLAPTAGQVTTGETAPKVLAEPLGDRPLIGGAYSSPSSALQPTSALWPATKVNVGGRAPTAPTNQAKGAAGANPVAGVGTAATVPSTSNGEIASTSQPADSQLNAAVPAVAQSDANSAQRTETAAASVEEFSAAESSLHELEGLQGGEFDRAFIDRFTKDHQRAIAMYDRATSQCEDEDVRTFATKTIPTLRAHVRMAQATLPAGAQGQ
jgi:putative membrane protein